MPCKFIFMTLIFNVMHQAIYHFKDNILNLLVFMSFLIKNIFISKIMFHRFIRCRLKEFTILICYQL